MKIPIVDSIKNPSFETVKKSLLLITLFLPFIVVGEGLGNSDPWVVAYRIQQKKKSLLLDAEEDEQMIKLFNGFSIGVSGGLALFHGSLADYDIFAPFEDFGNYYQFGWRVYAEKKFDIGIGAKLDFEKGTLGGGRLIGKESLPLDFESEYSTVNLKASFDVLNQLFGSSDLDSYKFYLNAEVGIGLTFFRAISTWRPVGTQQGEIRDFVGYTVVDDNPPTQRYVLEGKDSPATALNIPIGFTAGYRVNHKTDLTLSYVLNNLMTDRLDSWDREFSANDKYSYWGVGLRYNFNRYKEDYPKKKKKPKKEPKDKKWSLFGSKKEDVQPNDVALPAPLESRQSNPITPDQSDEQLNDIKMKMFELQLKLFEMQYLLDGGEGTPPAQQPGISPTSPK
ncbi:MAG: hypothetical protein MK086_02060 [Flavobacteriales bacterium]|nr:hypothetical protein [Flavobacteriales bacterium]